MKIVIYSDCWENDSHVPAISAEIFSQKQLGSCYQHHLLPKLIYSPISFFPSLLSSPLTFEVVLSLLYITSQHSPILS